MKAKAGAVLSVACLLSLGGCGGGSDSGPTVIPPVIDCADYSVRLPCGNSSCNEPPVVGTCPDSCPGPSREEAIAAGLCGLSQQVACRCDGSRCMTCSDWTSLWGPSEPCISHCPLP
jgi:hypothetical protein